MCTRREFFAGAAAPVLWCCVACGTATDPGSNQAQPFAEVTADEIVIRLSAVPAFAQPDAILVIYEANVIVLHVADTDYRAFSNICTHAGCGITTFVDDRFRCQCHGSEYDMQGQNVVGPALFPLKRYDVNVDTASGILRIDRRS